MARNPDGGILFFYSQMISYSFEKEPPSIHSNIHKLVRKCPLRKTMTSKILVAFYTKGGASEEYAKVIAETLSANGLVVEQRNLASLGIPDIEAFTTVILGTGVRISMVYRRWKKILKQKSLGTKRLFMFLSSGTAIEKPEEAVDKFLRPLVEKYHLKPEMLVSFPGKIPEKWAKLDGKKETMDPEKAKAWAQQIAHMVKST